MKNLYKYLAGTAVTFNLVLNKVWAADPPEIADGEAITLFRIREWVGEIFKFIIYAGSIIIFIALIWAGIMYATAGGDEAKVKKAKGVLRGAIIGAIVFVGITTILATIETLVTGEAFFN